MTTHSRSRRAGKGVAAFLPSASSSTKTVTTTRLKHFTARMSADVYARMQVACAVLSEGDRPKVTVQSFVESAVVAALAKLSKDDRAEVDRRAARKQS